MTPPMDEAMELKPCPFCGASEPWIIPPTCEETTDYDPADRAFPIVICNDCGARAHGLDWDVSKQSAIAAWNTRAAIEASGAHELAGAPDRVRELVDQEISAWAFANDIDGALRNDLMRRIRAALPAPPVQP